MTQYSLKFVKLNPVTLWALGSVFAVGAWMSSCGGDSPIRNVYETPQSPATEAMGSLGSGNGVDSSLEGSGSPSDAEDSGDDGSLLFSQILSPSQPLRPAKASERAQLLTSEAQRCRQSGQNFLSKASGITVPVPKELLARYESKHVWINPFDRCRQQLGLMASSGPRMRKENLIKLENCSRIQEIDQQPDLPVRDELRQLLMAENLSLLCSMGNEELTSPVQEALSLGFTEAWGTLGK